MRKDGGVGRWRQPALGCLMFEFESESGNDELFPSVAQLM